MLHASFELKKNTNHLTIVTILVTWTVPFINKPFLCCTYKVVRIRPSLQLCVYHIFNKYLLSAYHV